MPKQISRKTAASKRVAAKERTAKRGARSRTAARDAATRATAARPPRDRQPRVQVGEPSTIGSVAAAVRGTLSGAVAAVSQAVSGRRDAIGLLESDHRRMESLLKRGEETTTRAGSKRRQLLATITKELAIHEMLEERLFYPALEPYPEARDKVLEGFEEHHAADLVMKELHRMAVDGERWAATFKVLQEMIQHHIREEERMIFRVARGVLGKDELGALARRMTTMKAAHGGSRRTPAAQQTLPRGRRSAHART